MKKFGWKLLALIFLVALVFIWLIRAPIFSSYLSSKIGISISIRWIGIWPSRMNIHAFSIKNPTGFKGDAFAAEKIVCNYRLKTLLGDPLEIDQIEIQNSLLQIDFVNSTGTENNWTALIKSVSEQKSKGNLLIEKLILKNFNVEIIGSNLFLKPKQTHFNYLEFNDIGSQEGFPVKRLIKLIFGVSGLEDYIQDALDPEKDLERILSPLPSF